MDMQQEVVFVVQYLSLLGDDREDVKLIGIYRTYELATEAVERLKDKLGFRDHARIVDPMVYDNEEGFHIDEYELDKDHWAEGFITKFY